MTALPASRVARRRPAAALALLAGLARTVPALAAALVPLAAHSRAAPATTYRDAELIRGFMLTVFGAETMDSARDVDAALRVKKFTGPVEYKIVDRVGGGAAALVRDFAADLTAAVDNLRLVEVAGPLKPQLTIYLVRRGQYVATIRRTAWPGVDTSFLETNACSSVMAARPDGIERANVYIVADEGFVALAHCMVEEIAQSLGPANDSDELPDSIFNDVSTVSVFSEFDWFILSMLYDRRVAPGMTPEEVLPLLPAAIADARRRLPQVLAMVRSLDAHRTAASRRQ